VHGPTFGSLKMYYFYIKFPTVVQLRFCAMEQLWTAENSGEALKAFRRGVSVRLIGNIFTVSRTILQSRIIAEVMQRS
jgi:hypothetical protein